MPSNAPIDLSIFEGVQLSGTGFTLYKVNTTNLNVQRFPDGSAAISVCENGGRVAFFNLKPEAVSHLVALLKG